MDLVCYPRNLFEHKIKGTKKQKKNKKTKIKKRLKLKYVQVQVQSVCLIFNWVHSFAFVFHKSNDIESERETKRVSLTKE